VAATLIGDREIDVVHTGIRPGEKIHEILVSEEEAYRTIERDGHYVIRPLLPELHPNDTPGPLTGEYSSADAVVVGEELKQLLGEAEFVDVAMGAGRARVSPLG